MDKELPERRLEAIGTSLTSTRVPGVQSMSQEQSKQFADREMLIFRCVNSSRVTRNLVLLAVLAQAETFDRL